MAGTERTATHSLNRLRRIGEKPYAYGFFAALRLLDAGGGDKPRLGYSRRPKDDPLRLGQEATLTFAPATLAGFKPGKEGRPAHLNQFFFGLFGPNGPLPLHLTEYARDRIRNHNDPTFAAFIDIFHHRLLTLFYRAWAAARPAVHWDRPLEDRFSMYVGAQLGLGMPAWRKRGQVEDEAKLFYSSRFSSSVRNAEGLGAILNDFFGLPFRVEEFVPQWQELPAECQLRLGQAGPGNALGTGAALGERVMLCQQKIRLHLGPLSLAEHETFTPGGANMEKLADLVRSYLGEEITWDLQLSLKNDNIPPLQLGHNCRMGWTTWLSSGDQMPEVEDLTINPEERKCAQAHSEWSN